MYNSDRNRAAFIRYIQTEGSIWDKVWLPLLKPLHKLVVWWHRNKLPYNETQEFLDNCIRGWRIIRDSKDDDQQLKDLSHAYIDAFQSVRVKLFDETLPPED